MKNSPLASVLLVLLACAALGSLILCGMYIHTTRELRSLQSDAAAINQKQGYMNSLAGDLIEYSKRNPAIDPLLESINLKPRTGGTAAPTNGSSPNSSKTGSK
jgi:hypothetical protein